MTFTQCASCQADLTVTDGRRVFLDLVAGQPARPLGQLCEACHQRLTLAEKKALKRQLLQAPLDEPVPVPIVIGPRG